MSLGPNKLNHHILRKIIKQKKYKQAIKEYHANKIGWSHTNLNGLKKEIRCHLRKSQDQRCVFCRRTIKIERRNAYEDIEHFLDKSKSYYKKWSFTCVNLALACHACNMEKSTRDMGPSAMRTSLSYNRNYSWLHPYYHDYHQNIKIQKGWIYSIEKNAPNQTEADNLITQCKLCEVERIESYAESIRKKIEDLTYEIFLAASDHNTELVTQLSEESLEYQDELSFI